MNKTKIKRNTSRKRHKLIVIKVLSVALLLFSINVYAQDGGVIVLENQVPATQVLVTAMQQVVLKPGFHAVGASGNFLARIGQTNSLSPLIPIAQSSTVIIPASPSLDQNFIKTSTYLFGSDESPTMNTIQYFDGLGRPLQTVQMGITQRGADLVSQVKYDVAGRDWKKYLPTPVNGNFGQYADPSTLSYPDSRSFTETLYDASPLDRVEQQKGPGIKWDNKSTITSYESNDATIMRFSVNSGSKQFLKVGNYAANSLYKTVTTDEDGNTVTEFKNKHGQVLMKRSSTDVDTYYLYNDLDQLCYVLPPNFVAGMGSTSAFGDDDVLVKQFAYLYKYDGRGNNIEKRLPGCEPIYMLYDTRDRLIVSQDGNQRAQSKWLINKYDYFGRVLYTGILNCEIDQSFKTLLQTDGIVESYVGGNSSFCNTGYSCKYFDGKITLLTVNYYNDYSFISLLPENQQPFLKYEFNSGYDNAYPTTATSIENLNATGLLTGTRTYILDGTGTNYLAAAMYYDDKGHIVQNRSTNQLGGYDIVFNAYKFTGQLTKTLVKHSVSATINLPLTELYTYSYDHALRPLTTTYSLNGATAITLASNSYDELGRLSGKQRHGISDSENYEYNIRNWPTKIVSGIGVAAFEEELFYNETVYNNVTPCYNGNIAASTWKYKGIKKAYSYTYDRLNRLNQATGYQISGNTLYAPNNKEEFSYDKQGNIKYLGRQTNTYWTDALFPTYNGNQITSLYDHMGSLNQYGIKEYNDLVTSNEFKYDGNGNMTKDLDRNIVTIQYNILNLPEIVQFKNGNQIKNTYDASGQKLGTEYFTYKPTIQTPIVVLEDEIYQWEPGEFDQGGTAYIGNFEYKTLNGDAAQTTLSRIYNDEGYVENLSSPNYYYYRKDHLGNNREVWRANDKKTVQYTQYYPSGLPWANNDGDNPGEQQRKYNGKEFVEMHGYDTYDIVWRQYYPAIGRFQTPDPEAEEFYDLSPYSMCENNMVINIDPDGRFSTRFGAWIYKIFNGGEIKWSNDKGEYFVGKQVKYKGEGVGVAYERKFSFNNNNKSGKVLNASDKGIDFVRDFAASSRDFISNYNDMKNANWKNSDKYFHSKANFEASRRGPGGNFFATHFSNLREITDQRIKGDSRKDSEADQKANRYGKSQGKKYRNKRGKVSFKEAIPEYRPSNLPEKY